MNHKLMLAGLLLGTAALSLAQTMPDAQSSAPPAAGQTQTAPAPAKPQADTAQQNASAPAIPVTLDKSVDSKKAKAGDPIIAKLSVSLNDNKGTQIPAGTKVIGHVTDAKAKSKGDTETSISFAFDKISLKDGKDIPFKAVAQAIGAPLNNGPIVMGGGNNGGPQAAAPGQGPGAGASGGSSAQATGGGGQAGKADPDMAGPNSNNGRLSQNSTGVVGMKGVNLTSQADSSVVSSDSKSLKLDSGTQMLLKVVSQ